MIEAKNAAVRIGSKPIIKGVSFEARPGQLTAIIGPNGSGKTTLLRALSGDLGYSGMISINGHDLARQKPWELAAIRAVLAQSTTLSFPFTVREIVKLGLLTGKEGGRDASLADQALDRVDLPGFAGRFYQELSGGEQQRVQLARVLCQVWQPVAGGTPRWLFLDEPVSSLDIKHQLAIMRIARDYADAGGGVIAVLHDLNLTAMFADKVLAMQKGRLAAAGAPVDVLDDALLSEVFECGLKVGGLPAKGVPFVLPQSSA